MSEFGSRVKKGMAAVALPMILIVAHPVFGEKKPQSLLPPGFDQGTPPAQSEDKKSGDKQPTDLLDELKLNTGPAPSNASASASASSGDATDALGNAVAAVDDTADIAPPSYDLSPEQRRSLAQIGVIGPDAQGLQPNAFGHIDGKALEQVMHRTSAPIASRWVSIVLRRALLSNVMTPPHVHGADWVAERAWLLLRMGEADAARMLIQRVDTDNYTPKLYEVALQSALANADIASICPIVPQAMRVSEEPAWAYARAMCAALSGESAGASVLLTQANRSTDAQGIDSQLAERFIGAGKNARHAVMIQWDGVDQLSAWRFGTATAVGLSIPTQLYGTVRPNVRAWAARAPLLKASDKIDAADWAAALGVFSSKALVDLYSSLADDPDAPPADNSPSMLLRNAYAGDSVPARMAALNSLWTAPNLDTTHQYARLILTARAAALMPVSDDLAKYDDQLVAAMFTAGLDLQAQRWARIAQASNDLVSQRAWGLLAVGAPQRVVDISAGRISAYRATGEVRARFLVAALIGLGRIDPGHAGNEASAFGIDIARKTIWSRTIDAAAERGEAGTVVLLAAAGLQSQNWDDIPPEFLFHIVAAFRRVGLEPEARMVAAEALTRA